MIYKIYHLTKFQYSEPFTESELTVVVRVTTADAEADELKTSGMLKTSEFSKRGTKQIL